MPPRWLSLTVLAFWLSSTGYLLVWPAVRDLLRSGQPPPYTIDLADEAQHNPAPIQWDVSHNGQESYKAATSVRYNRDDDTFELRVVLTHKPRGPGESRRGAGLVLKRVDSAYVVSREGGLIRTHLRADLELPGPFGAQETRAELDGEVQGNRFVARYRLHSLLGDLRGDIDPVEVGERGSVLNPLHPLARIGGLRPGQSWRQPALADPTGDAIAGHFGVEARAPALEARVLPEAQPFVWDGRERSCLVIEYRDDDDELRARTWVLRDGGQVLRQEAWQDREHWVFTRVTKIDGL
jgi:hypothetical protein